jgi:hypothetical protein
LNSVLARHRQKLHRAPPRGESALPAPGGRLSSGFVKRPRLPPLLPKLAMLAQLSMMVAACGSGTKSDLRLWTMTDLQTQFELGEQMRPYSNPGGLVYNYFVGRDAQQNEILQLKLSFSQGQPAAYITTDFWSGYEKIWVQPMYILVTAWDDAAPLSHQLPGSWAIMSVGPGSGFYSPYWKIVYVEVRPGTAPDHYTSERQLFEDGLPMHEGPNRFGSVQPDGLSAPGLDAVTPVLRDYVAVDATHSQDDILAGVAASPRSLPGWIDGVEVPYLDFGVDGFTADSAAVVRDIPLFTFRHRDQFGNLMPVDTAANVGGIAPPFSGGPEQVSGAGRPLFGGLWRLYTVEIPGDALELTDDQRTRHGLGDEWRPYVHRVALQGQTCFQSAGPASAACVWLDSQAQIETWVSPEAIVRTPLEPACPFVMWEGRAVPNPLPPPAGGP